MLQLVEVASWLLKTKMLISYLPYQSIDKIMSIYQNIIAAVCVNRPNSYAAVHKQKVLVIRNPITKRLMLYAGRSCVGLYRLCRLFSY